MHSYSACYCYGKICGAYLGVLTYLRIGLYEVFLAARIVTNDKEHHTMSSAPGWLVVSLACAHQQPVAIDRADTNYHVEVHSLGSYIGYI